MVERKEYDIRRYKKKFGLWFDRQEFERFGESRSEKRQTQKEVRK